MSTRQPKSLLSSFANSVNFERSAVADVWDWKNNVRGRKKLFVPSNQAFQGNTSRVEGICSQYWILFEAIIQLILRFVPVFNQTSTGQLFSPLSQASWYDYNVC